MSSLIALFIIRYKTVKYGCRGVSAGSSTADALVCAVLQNKCRALMLSCFFSCLHPCYRLVQDGLCSVAFTLAPPSEPGNEHR